jgi:Eco57I restriction-modification methylase
LGLDRMARDVDEKLSKARLASGEANDHSHALIFIDYKSLGVRHLGSIYEGLLEFKLRIAPETMAVVEGKRTEEIVPHSEAIQQKRRILTTRQGKDRKERLYQKGAVYLENDRRERKATGSYYTPDYIVQYIVEQTVGPILKEKLEKLRVVFRAAQEYLRNEENKLKALRRTDIDPAHNTYNAYRVSLNEAFFDLKVLDPAMGSGHFLVEVVDYITDQLAKFLNAFRWNPVVYELALTRKKIEDGMREQGVTVDGDKLTDLNLLKRRVLKSCVYGVDVTPMAVELAKVSLWLDCFTLGAPLSFLDHHMKCGNSLIGANVEDVHRGISENLFGYQFGYLLQAAQLMRGVSKLSDVTAKEVAESHETYQQAYENLAPYKRLFDIWLSQYFGNKKAQDIANQHAQAIVDNKYAGLDARDVSTINAALPLAANKHFFHWELEFPEVFFDEAERKKDAGFDAVVGNPPYDELSEYALGRIIDETRYFELEPRYKMLGGGRLNWYHYFMMLALNIARLGGRHSFIVPMSLMSDQFTLSLRRWLLENYQLVAIDAFPQKDNPKKRIFFDAKLPTCIYFVRREKSSDAFRVRVHSTNEILDLSPTYYPDLLSIKALDSTNLSIPLVSEKGWQILKKCAVNMRLGKLSVVGAKPTSGEIVFNQQFRKYLTEDASYTLVLRGSHVQRYDLADEAKQGEPVYIKKDLYLADAKPGSKAFDHLKERVVYQEGAAIDNWRRVIATLLPPDLICGHKICYFTDYKISQKALLAVFSSKLVDWYVTALSTNNSLSAYLVGSIRFPIFNMTTSPTERARYLAKAKLLYQQCMSKDDQDCVLGFVEHHLAKVPEESDVVHDLLAFLAEEMLRLNKEKRALQKTFLAYFVDALQVRTENGKAGIEVLTGKSKLQEFAGDYQKGEEALTPDGLWEIVQKNRAKVNVGRVGLQGQVLARYQESLDQVLPLKEQLRRTDALIDRVVYRLYGLTEEEVGIVEGKG